MFLCKIDYNIYILKEKCILVVIKYGSENITNYSTNHWWKLFLNVIIIQNKNAEHFGSID